MCHGLCYFRLGFILVVVFAMSRDYEVIIVGAGPAGATLAYELVRRGIRVLILEKATFPRYKCCAGGLSVKAAKLLDMDLSGVREDTISSADITFAGASHYHVDYGQPILYTVMRNKFDYSLLKRAEEAGAEVLQGLRVYGIHPDVTGVEVLTTAGDFQAQFVAGADGVRSTVARTLDVKANGNHLIAIETEVQVAREDMAKWKSRVMIDIGRISGGYAWLFPKSDHLSVGIACSVYKARDLKRRYQDFVNSLNLNHYTITRWSGGLIPVCTGQTVVARGRVVLLGDAAGLTDPLTGEGIYNAILSAQLAAPAIEKSLHIGEAGLNDYRQSVEEKIMPEMRTAYMFSKVFSLLPFRLFKLLKRDERVWRGCCYLLRGETDY